MRILVNFIIMIRKTNNNNNVKQAAIIMIVITKDIYRHIYVHLMLVVIARIVVAAVLRIVNVVMKLRFQG